MDLRRNSTVLDVLKKTCRVLLAGMVLSGWQTMAQAQPREPECGLSVKPMHLPADQVSLLAPVSFEYVASYQEQCQLKVNNIVHIALACNKPVITTRTGTTLTSLTSTVQVSCLYALPGIFYTSPIEIETLRQDGQRDGYYYPGSHKVIVEAFSEDFDRQATMETWNQLMPWQSKYLQERIAYAVMGFALLGIAGFAIYRYSRKKRVQQTANPPCAQNPTPLEHCLDELAQLVNITPMTIQEYKQYHDTMSRTLRRMISACFEFDAMSLTTLQLSQTLKSHNVPNALCNELQRILKESDRVKFALEAPSQNLILLRDTACLASKLATYAEQWHSNIIESQTPSQDIPVQIPDSIEQSKLAHFMERTTPKENSLHVVDPLYSAHAPSGDRTCPEISQIFVHPPRNP